MKRSVTGFALICFALFVPTPGQAQEAWHELLCRVLSVKSGQGSAEAQIGCGRLDGIGARSRLGVPMRPFETGRPRADLPAEDLRLQSIGYFSTRVQLQARTGLQAGDLIPVEILQTSHATQKLYDLSRLAIVFTSQGGVPWVLYRDYAQNPTYDFESERLPLMLFEVQRTASQADEVYGLEPLREGIFAGMTLREAMLNSHLPDLQDFLDFVAAYPGKYIGHHWKFAEVYATWVINGAPGPDDPETEKIPEPVEPEPPEEAVVGGELPQEAVVEQPSVAVVGGG